MKERPSPRFWVKCKVDYCNIYFDKRNKYREGYCATKHDHITQAIKEKRNANNRGYRTVA